MKHITLCCAGFMLTLFIFCSSAISQQSLQWTPSNVISVGTILKIAEGGEGTLYAMADSGIIASIDGGKTFHFTPQHPSLKPEERFSDMTVMPNGTVIVGVGSSHSAALLSSTDQGSSWSRISVPGSYVGPIGIQALPNGKLFVALGISFALFETGDNGKTWDTIRSAGFMEGSMGGFTISPSGGIFNYGTSYAAWSSDTGKTWNPTSSVAFGNPGGPIVGVVSNNYTDIFLCDAGGVFYSSDAGMDWVSRNTGISNLNTSGLAIDSKGRLFVSSYTDGVFISFNKGDSWWQNTSGLDNTHVQSLLLSKVNYLYAGTVDKIYRTIATLGVGDPVSSQQTLITPNPVTTATTINYFLSSTGYVDVNVYDVLGNQAAHLASGIMESGSHSFRFDASRVPSGTYYCRIQAGGSVETKAIIVAR